MPDRVVHEAHDKDKRKPVPHFEFPLVPATLEVEDMDAALWSGLPSEIEARVLSYLSVPVLWWFRTVRKRWNSLICNSEFGALCIRNAAQDASFLVARSYTGERDDESGPDGDDWFPLQRWMGVPGREGKAEVHHREQVFDRFDVADCECFVAMDGGLVCEVVQPRRGSQENASVFVSNPIAQSESRLLPTPKHRLETGYAGNTVWRTG